MLLFRQVLLTFGAALVFTPNAFTSEATDEGKRALREIGRLGAEVWPVAQRPGEEPREGADVRISGRSWKGGEDGLKLIGKLDRVYELRFSQLDVTENVVSLLEKLPHLQTLSLFGCDITDGQFLRFGHFPSLREITLCGSAVSATDLLALENLNRIEKFVYAGSSLGDEGVGALRKAKKLQHLGLAATKVTDRGLEAISRLSDLNWLVLARTQITDDGLRHLAGLEQLAYLDLEETPIRGPGLKHVAGLTRLKYLNLQDTQVRSVHLKHLATLSRLEHLDLSRTKIDDEHMAYLRNLTAVRHLTLDATTISDRGLAHLRTLKKLERLSLKKTNVNGEAFQYFSELPNRHGGYGTCLAISLKGSPVSDEGLVHVAKVAKLTDLDLGDTKITNDGLSHLASLKELEFLSLTGCAIDDAGLRHLAGMKSLTGLFIWRTGVTEEGVKALEKALPKCGIVHDGLWKSAQPVQEDAHSPRLYLDLPAREPEVPTSPPPRLTDKLITNSIGMKLVLIPAGEFMMGSPESEEGRESNEKQHRVRITRPFYLGVYEVTQAEYERVMGTNPSWFSSTGGGKDEVAGRDTRNHPVETVSWNDAVEFCRKLSAQEGRTYRLPTEAEWEYACRAGTQTPFHFGSQLNGREANCDGNYPYGTQTKGPYLERTTEVGSYRPNAWGLYDMHGNIYEWCQDWYDSDYYADSPNDDPQGPTSGSPRVFRGGSWYGDASRVYRGGSWYGDAWCCRSASRSDLAPGIVLDALGFRLALVPAE